MLGLATAFNKCSDMDTLKISTLLLQHHSLEHFSELVAVVQQQAAQGAVFLEFDVRPPFGDTPENWQEILEATFTTYLSNEH